MKVCIAMLMVLALPAVPGLSKAQGEEKPASTLEEVVVTASRMEEKKKEITSNIIIIDEDEINNSSARDLGDLLAEKGIGHIHKYPGALTSFGIRGVRTDSHGNDLDSYVLILVNGRRAGTGNAAKIMTKNIERIEIIRGPASVQYGSAAMGGVVNVITRQGTEKPMAFVEGILGSFGHEEVSMGFSGKVEDFDFSGSFTKSSMDDYDTGDGEKYHNTGFDKEDNCSLNIGYEFLPGNRIGLIYSRFDVDDAGNPDCLSAIDADDYVEKSNESIDLIYNGKTSDGFFSWMIRYFDGEDEDKWFNPAGSDPGGWDAWSPVSGSKTDQKGAQAQASVNWETSRITAGIDWVNYEVETTWAPFESEYDNPAFFMLGKTRLMDERLILSGGLRYDEYEVDMKNQGGDEDDDNLCPRFGVAYLVSDYLKLRANYGESFKMPTAAELAGNYPGWSGNYVGNPDLDPESSKTYEAGLDLSYASFNAAITCFFTEFDDYIDTVATSTGDTTWENVDGATINGIEGDMSYNIGIPLGWNFELKPYVNFVYLFEYEDDETGDDLQYTSDLTVSWGITVSDLEGLTADLIFTYTGEQKITDYEGATYGVIDKGGFTVANLTISKKVLDYEQYGSITLRGEITNLMDKDYEYVQGYPMSGRSFFVGVRYDF